MRTNQNDTNLLTENQLDSLSGGPHYQEYRGAGHNFRFNVKDSTGQRLTRRKSGLHVFRPVALCRASAGPCD